MNIIRYTRPHYVSKKTGIYYSRSRMETFRFKSTCGSACGRSNEISVIDTDIYLHAISRSFFIWWWERGKIRTTHRNLDRFENLTYGTNVNIAIYQSGCINCSVQYKLLQFYWIFFLGKKKTIKEVNERCLLKLKNKLNS